jgi:colicin import membrane protein
MIRKHENSDSWKAGIYAVGVHLALLVGMLISFNWKAAHPVLNVTEVELWDKLPAPKVVQAPKPEPKPEIKEAPKPEPKPIVEDKPKPEEPKVDIELEKKKREQDRKEAEEKIRQEHEQQVQKQKELDDQRKKDALEKIKLEAREDELRDKKAAEKSKNDALKKLQQEALSDEKANDDKQASAANASIIGEYTEKIKAKIRNNVNKSLCGDGNPELRFEINVLPTGQISGSPKITKSSDNSACDEAVERAIISSEPLPLPDDPSLKSQFKNLKLKFRPND